MYNEPKLIPVEYVIITLKELSPQKFPINNVKPSNSVKIFLLKKKKKRVTEVKIIPLLFWIFIQAGVVKTMINNAIVMIVKVVISPILIMYLYFFMLLPLTNEAKKSADLLALYCPLPQIYIKSTTGYIICLEIYWYLFNKHL